MDPLLVRDDLRLASGGIGGNSLSEREFSLSLVLILGYLLVQLLSNLTVSKTTPFLGTLTIPIGSLLWAISFTWIDLVNDYLGERRARKLVLGAVVANLCMILWLNLYILLPGTEAWNAAPFNQRAIEFVLGGYARIYAASLIGMYIVENVDISIFHYHRWNYPTAPRWSRSFVSNSISAPLDAIVFSILAFYGTMSIQELLALIGGGIVYKLLVGYVSIPAIYLVKPRHERPQA